MIIAGLFLKDITMAIKDIQNIEKEESSFALNEISKTSQKLSTTIYKVLIISESSSDIFMINKFLSKSSGFRVDEAVNFSSALKIINHLALDLIIVDEVLSKIDGYEVINRLNRDKNSKNIPKILLVSDNVDSKEAIANNNVDFIKKPLNAIDFKRRVRSIIELSNQSNGYFQNMADIKYFESKDYSSLYKHFFDLDSNVLFIYDQDRHKVIESNPSFNALFSSIYQFNRVLSNEKLFRKFIPFMNEENYLNHYNPSSWLKMVSFSKKSSFMLQINRSNKLYNFVLEFHTISISNENIIMCKFINTKNISAHGLHIENSLLVKKEDLKKLEKSLDTVKEQVGYLSGGFMSENIYNELDKIKTTLNVLVSGKKNSKMDLQEEQDFEKINAYEVVGKILKKKYPMKKVLLNSNDIHDSFECDKESLYVHIDALFLQDIVSGVLSSYFSGDFDESSNKDFLRVDVYKDQNNLLIEIIEQNSVKSKNFFMDKFLKRKSENSDLVDVSDEILPKNVEQAIRKLSAKLKKAFISNENIFLISIPL